MTRSFDGRPTFKLNPGQEAANRLMGGPQLSTLLVGGARSGKTFLYCRAIATRALRASESRHAILRLRANAVRASVWLDTWPKMMKTCFPGVAWRPNNRDGYIEMPNKSEIWMGGLDDKERVDKILGQEFATILQNEASQIPYSSRLVLKTRLAQKVLIDGTNQYLPLREYIDLNPGGSNHWTYREFIQKIDPQDHSKPLRDPENYQHMFLNPEQNSDNLDPAYLEMLRNLPAKQRKRFFEGVYVPEVEGALWSFDVIARSRFVFPAGWDDSVPLTGDQMQRLIQIGALPSMIRVVVAIDPSGTKGVDGDSVGIVVVGKGEDGRGYVLADRTARIGPAGWGRIAVSAYHEFSADCIVAEVNFGGAMVQHVIMTTDGGGLAPYKEVHASRGKAIRAEPASVLYDRSLVTHVGSFPWLEDQMGNFSTAGYVGEGSPDRADALVWALTELLVEEDKVALWAKLGAG